MKTREEIALAMLPAIYTESLNHEMDPYAIATDAFHIADAFIEIRDAGRDKETIKHAERTTWREGVPDSSRDVLFCLNGGRPQVGYYCRYERGWFNIENQDVDSNVVWMELPAPPQNGDTE